MHKSRSLIQYNQMTILNLVIVKSAISLVGFEPTTLLLQVLWSDHLTMVPFTKETTPWCPCSFKTKHQEGLDLLSESKTEVFSCGLQLNIRFRRWYWSYKVIPQYSTCSQTYRVASHLICSLLTTKKIISIRRHLYSTKIKIKIQRCSRQLHEINNNTLVDKLFEQFLENMNSLSILDVIWKSVPREPQGKLTGQIFN